MRFGITYASFADLNGDGFADAALSSANGVTLVKHNGSREQPEFILVSDQWSEFGQSPYLMEDVYLYPAMLLDMDGDGDQDLYGPGYLGGYSGWNSQPVWSINAGAPGEPLFNISDEQALLPFNGVIPFGWPYWTQQVDFDSDGLADFQHINANNQIVVQRNIGTRNSPYYRAASQVTGLTLALSVEGTETGRSVVTLALTNSGSTTQRVGIYVDSSESKIQRTTGPYQVVVQPGETHQRTLPIPVSRQKNVSVRVVNSQNEIQACQSVVLYQSTQ